MKIDYKLIKSNGRFGIVAEPFEHKQHPNQQEGLDLYVQVLDFWTTQVNTVKLYENKKGLHFKKDGSHYLEDFTETVAYVPFQIRKDFPKNG